MKCFKLLLSVFALLFVISSVSGAQVYNQNGDFSVYLDEKTKTVFNDDIKTYFLLNITNNQAQQTFNIDVDPESGWNINYDDQEFTLSNGETRQIRIDLVANSDFDYDPTVVSPDTVVISQKEDYVGYFEFPTTILGENENVSMRLSVGINSRENEPIDFSPKISIDDVSPVSPLRYSITSSNLQDDVDVSIRAFLGENLISEFTDSFSQNIDYKIYSHNVPLRLDPGRYDASIIVRKSQEGSNSAQEWFDTASVQILPYENLVIDEEISEDFFIDTYKYYLDNQGNVDTVYEDSISVNFFSSMFFSSNVDYEKKEGEILIQENVPKGESKTIIYSFNYIPVYVLVVVILIMAVYIYVRKTSNPLNVEPKIYDVKKVTHEGVKSIKIKIGFENSKLEEIDTLKVIFRMPSYLKVKEESFLLSPPKNVFKGRDQYKLLWEFKRFEKLDSRILGFSLVNDRGILGDIKLPPIEFEVKVGGKVRKYYVSLPTIKG